MKNAVTFPQTGYGLKHILQHAGVVVCDFTGLLVDVRSSDCLCADAFVANPGRSRWWARGRKLRTSP